MSNTLLIPSAGLVPDELKLDLGPIPTGMIPLDGKTAFEHIAQSYEEAGTSPDFCRIILCYDGSEKIRNWQERSEYDWEVIDVDDPNSLGETIEKGICEGIELGLIDDSGMFIHFADTLVYPTSSSDQRDRISFDYVDHPLRWTTFETSSDDRISEISSKYTNGNEQQKKTFVGQFQISNPYSFHQVLQQTLEKKSINDYDPYYTSLLEYLSNKNYDLRQPDRWIDLGHLDTYHAAGIEYLNTRGFNHLHVDKDKFIVKKQSDNTEILSPEIRWYDNLPADMKPLIPHVLNYSTEEDPYIKLEFVGYPKASDLYLYGGHDIHIWKTIFSSILDIVDRFRSHKAESANMAASAREEMFLNKTISRLSQASDQENLQKYFESDSLTINGTEYPSVKTIATRLEDDLKQRNLLDTFEPTLIHGDLSLSNIMVDVRSHKIKLVDPRGEFGSYDIHGDYLYDLAKLTHSVCGQYEFIINDRFTVNTQDDTINYSIWNNENHDRRQNLFITLLQSRYPQEFNRIKAIESLLWLSMLPLHSDKPDRQYVMLGQGIEKYSSEFIR
ncbi:hypothetical protein [Halorubrum distributum]|uniref:hypothetical protein n=1 Tax=Halorubrum distributum TaxID=29283 RepID=UPI000AFF4380|nr:hypothetical protein [Halorubrum litoreum]